MIWKMYEEKTPKIVNAFNGYDIYFFKSVIVKNVDVVQ